MLVCVLWGFLLSVSNELICHWDYCYTLPSGPSLLFHECVRKGGREKGRQGGRKRERKGLGNRERRERPPEHHSDLYTVPGLELGTSASRVQSLSTVLSPVCVCSFICLFMSPEEEEKETGDSLAVVSSIPDPRTHPPGRAVA